MCIVMRSVYDSDNFLRNGWVKSLLFEDLSYVRPCTKQIQYMQTVTPPTRTVVFTDALCIHSYKMNGSRSGRVFFGARIRAGRGTMETPPPPPPWKYNKWKIRDESLIPAVAHVSHSVNTLDDDHLETLYFGSRCGTHISCAPPRLQTRAPHNRSLLHRCMTIARPTRTLRVYYYYIIIITIIIVICVRHTVRV